MSDPAHFVYSSAIAHCVTKLRDHETKTVDEYIDEAPEHAREKLLELRQLLRKVAPKATESIKWGTPVFEENRILFAFAAHKAHINFIPTPASLDPFKDELKPFKTGKGSIQLPYDKPLPAALIKKIAKHRADDVRLNDAHWM